MMASILALDTSTEACSVALQIGGDLYERRQIAPRKHAELILPMVEDVLKASSSKLTDLDAFAFGRGPGAFTGVRIAVGVIQGLALGAGLPVIPVSSLATLAQGVSDKQVHIFAAIDARMGEIYWALYEKNQSGIVQLQAREKVTSPNRVDVVVDKEVYGVGTGWGTYQRILKTRFKDRLIGLDPEHYPLAKNMLPLATAAFENGDLLPAEKALPVYLRDKVTG